MPFQTTYEESGNTPKQLKMSKLARFFLCRYLNERGYQNAPPNGRKDYFSGYIIQSNNRKVITNHHQILINCKINNMDLGKE